MPELNPRIDNLLIGLGINLNYMLIIEFELSNS